MPITIDHSPSTNVLQINLSGTLSADDYQQMVPVVEQAIAEHGNLRLLVSMQDFHGWQAGALWEDLKFDFKHFGDFRKIAMVGDSKWQSGMATFCKPFTAATIKYFEAGHESAAAKWLCTIEGQTP